MEMEGMVEVCLTFWNGNIEDREPCFTTVKCETKITDFQRLNDGKIRMLPIECEGHYYFIPYENINQIEIIN